jgi:hypothetical protein
MNPPIKVSVVGSCFVFSEEEEREERKKLEIGGSMQHAA